MPVCMMIYIYVATYLHVLGRGKSGTGISRVKAVRGPGQGPGFLG